MGKKLQNTPRSKVRSALRQLFLRSRERAACLKAAEYKCARCGVKQSKAKGREVLVEVHHKDGILHWDQLIDLIYVELLCDPTKMETLCVTCHKGGHKEEENAQEEERRKAS
jgi:5-methylcytosine-specific restriction endonuclease McrA